MLSNSSKRLASASAAFFRSASTSAISASSLASANDMVSSSTDSRRLIFLDVFSSHTHCTCTSSSPRLWSRVPSLFTSVSHWRG